MLLFRQLQVAAHFYRTVALPHLVATAAIVLLALPFRAGHNATAPLLLKLLTWPALLYLHERMRPHGRWWWHNLGWSRPALWGAACGLDMLVFGLLMRLIFG